MYTNYFLLDPSILSPATAPLNYRYLHLHFYLSPISSTTTSHHSVTSRCNHVFTSFLLIKIFPFYNRYLASSYFHFTTDLIQANVQTCLARHLAHSCPPSVCRHVLPSALKQQPPSPGPYHKFVHYVPADHSARTFTYSSTMLLAMSVGSTFSSLFAISFPTRIRLGTKHRMYAYQRTNGYEDTMQVRLVVEHKNVHNWL
jgi:hypothetical protein